MLAFFSGAALPFTTALAHVITVRMERRQTPGASLLDIGVPLSQIATSMQLLTVMTQIRISWKEPIKHRKFCYPFGCSLVSSFGNIFVILPFGLKTSSSGSQEPFVTVLGVLSLFSPEALTAAFRAIFCVTPVSPVGKFLFQNVAWN